MPSLLPTVSVVIPTKNGGPTFVTLLSALRKQVHYADMEIRVVDSGSGDGTPEQAKEFGAEVLSIDPRTFNHGATRNLGIRESRGELIAMFTQDALPLGETYMLTLVESLQAAQAAGAYARQIPRPDASRLVRRDLESWIGSSPDKRIVKMESGCRFFALPPIERYRTCVFDNVAGLIRRRVWETFPIPPVPFGEDIEWAYRVLCNGYTLVYEPKAVVEHSHERSSEYLYKRTFVDHYRLYELFGLRTIPTRLHAWRSLLYTTGKNWNGLFRARPTNRSALLEFLNVPRYAWASAWGQYRGAKAAARGLPMTLSGDV